MVAFTHSLPEGEKGTWQDLFISDDKKYRVSYFHVSICTVECSVHVNGTSLFTTIMSTVVIVDQSAEGNRDLSEYKCYLDAFNRCSWGCCL